MLNISPWNLLFTVINILVLYWIFRKFLFQPVMKVINSREELVKQQFENAKKNQDVAEQMKTEYQDKLKTAHVQVEEIIIHAKQRAENEHDQMLLKTREESERMLERAKSDIKSEQVKAKQEVSAEIAKLAMIAAKKILETGELHDAASNE